jgi:long-chain acyl-CoA synthetase
VALARATDVTVASGGHEVSMTRAPRAAVAQTPTGDAWRTTGWEPGVPTLPELLQRWEQIAADRVALRVKRQGRWEELTYAAWAVATRRLGAGLVRLGVVRGDRIAVLSENRPEWLTACLAAQGLGAVPFGIYPTNAAAELHHQLTDSAAKVLFAEDQEQLDKAVEVLDRCPDLVAVIVLERRGTLAVIEADDRIHHLDDVLASGDVLLAQDPEVWDRGTSADPEDVAVLIYTSGTTGPPKGAMLTWRNVVAAIRLQAAVLEVGPKDEVLSYLPLCHVAEQVMSLYTPLGCGARVNFAESIETVQADLRAVRPTLLFAVPRINEKLLSSIQDRVADATPLKRAVYGWWSRVGGWLVDRRLGRHPTRYRWYEQVLRAVLWVVMTRSLRKHTGMSRVRVAISGGAPVAPAVLRFLLTLGVPVIEGYGMTEGAGTISLDDPEDLLLGSVGRPVPGVEVRVAGDGELLVRGDTVFAGYWGRPEATAETIDAEGWLHTGDVGEFTADGHLRLTDRKKDIIITAGGKNLSPSEIENRIKVSPYVKEAIVIGDGRRYVTALVQIEHDTVANWAQRQRIAFTTFRDLTERAEVLALIEAEVAAANRDLARVEQVKSFRLLPRALDQDDAELTATQKVRRSVVAERYGSLVEEMYR